MIGDDLPIIFSYDSITAKENHRIKMYTSLERAKNQEFDVRQDTTTSSHWMTIIGYSKFLNSEGMDYKYVFKVVSWGKIYYIDFDEYKQYVNPFTTIVKIGEY